jgi:Tfp pilus assembly protein PilN
MSRFNVFDPAQDPSLEQLRRLRRTVILQIAALGLAALALPLYLVFTQLRDEAAQAATELASVQARMEALNAPSPEVEALTAKVTEIDALTAALEAARPPAGVPWPAVIAAINAYDRSQIELTSLTQTDNRLVLEGRATDNPAVMAYVQQLAASPLFVSVEVQSIKMAARTQGVPASGRAQEAEPTPDPRPAQFVLALTVKL